MAGLWTVGRTIFLNGLGGRWGNLAFHGGKVTCVDLPNDCRDAATPGDNLRRRRDQQIFFGHRRRFLRRLGAFAVRAVTADGVGAERLEWGDRIADALAT